MTMQDKTKVEAPRVGVSALTGLLGTAVLVDGEVVAWFATFTEEAREWCTENYFGRWLAWRSKPPEIVPLTEAEYDEAMRRGKELASLFEDMPGEDGGIMDGTNRTSGGWIGQP